LALGSDHDGLPVAARRQGDIRVKSGRARDDLKIAAAAASLKGSADAPAAFAPGAGKRSTLGDYIAAEIEFVAVAGAEEPLVEAVPTSAHGIGGATSDALGRSVIEGDGTSAGPVAGEAGKRPRLGVAGAAGYGCHQQRKGCHDQSSYDRESFHGSAPLGLLARGFPSAAARHTRGRTVPSSRSGVAAELAIRKCATDRDPNHSLPSDAAGDVGAGRRDLAVGDRERRACRGFARTCLGHNGDVPKPVIGRLGGRGSGGKGNCGRGKKQSRKYRNAIVAHESFPRFGDDATYSGQCVQSLLRRGNAESSL
jgi:hypothetical protein